MSIKDEFRAMKAVSLVRPNTKNRCFSGNRFENFR